MSKNRQKIQKELEKIYDERYEWLNTGKALRKKTSDSFEKYPILKKMFILLVLANVGIYLMLFLSTFYWNIPK